MRQFAERTRVLKAWILPSLLAEGYVDYRIRYLLADGSVLEPPSFYGSASSARRAVRKQVAWEARALGSEVEVEIVTAPAPVPEPPPEAALPVVKLNGWLTVADAARRLGITTQRGVQLLDRGKLRHVQTPLGRLVDPASVEHRLRQQAARG